MAAHFGGAALAFLGGFAAFVGVPEIMDPGGFGAPFHVFMTAVTVSFVSWGIAAVLVVRALGQVIPTGHLGIRSPADWDFDEQGGLVGAMASGDADRTADRLDQLRGLDGSDARPWHPAGDVPDDQGQAVYDEMRELRETTRNRVLLGSASAPMAYLVLSRVGEVLFEPPVAALLLELGRAGAFSLRGPYNSGSRRSSSSVASRRSSAPGPYGTAPTSSRGDRPDRARTRGTGHTRLGVVRVGG